MMQIPVPVKVLECFCVGKRKMKEKDIADAIREDQKRVGFALNEFVERNILFKENSYYSLNPDFELSCRKIVEIYETVKLVSDQNLSGVYSDYSSGSEPLYIM